MKIIIFLIYYFIIISVSVSDFNSPELKNIYSFFDDKDKIMHFIQYFILVVLGLYTFKINVKFKNFIIILILLMFSSGIAEFIQLYLPTRDSSYTDWYYDILGGSSAFFTFAIINKLLCYRD